MFKFMKYEIKGTYRVVLSTILVVALATIGIQYSVSRIDLNQGLPQRDLPIVQILPVILMIVISVATIYFIVHLIQSYRKELFEDRAYLTFSLPIGGKKILGGKFLTAILWSLVFAIIVIAANYLAFNILFSDYMDLINDQFSFQFRIILDQIGRSVFSGLLFYGIVASLATLLIVYFSITLSKVAIKSRKIGGFWILIFIGLQIFFNYIEGLIIKYFPAFTTFGSGSPSVHNLMTTEYGFVVDIMTGSPVLPLSGIIYWIILGLGLFLATGYLLDKKLEL